MRYRGSWRVGLAVAVAVAWTVVASHRPASADTTRPYVMVANSANNAVPVTGTALVSGSVGISGTPNVTVANVPAVSARQSGAWNIGVTGTPSVALAGAPSVNIGSMPPLTLSSAPEVNLTGGSVNGARAPATRSRNLFALGIPFSSSNIYDVTPPIATSTILLHSDNNIIVDVYHACYDLACDNGGDTLRLGAFSSGNLSFKFPRPIIIRSIVVTNNESFFQTAAFSMSLFGE